MTATQALTVRRAWYRGRVVGYIEGALAIRVPPRWANRSPRWRAATDRTFTRRFR